MKVNALSFPYADSFYYCTDLRVLVNSSNPKVMRMIGFPFLFFLDASAILFSNMQGADHSAELMIIYCTDILEYKV